MNPLERVGQVAGQIHGSPVQPRVVIKTVLLSFCMPETQITDKLIDELLALDDINDHSVRRTIFDNRATQPLDIKDLVSALTRLKSTSSRMQDAKDVLPTQPVASYSPVYTCRQLSRAQLIRFIDQELSSINLLWYGNQSRFFGRNLISWVENSIVKSGMDPEFKIDDIVTEGELVKAFHLADLTHRINEKVLIPNELILVTSPSSGGNSLCPILDVSRAVTRGGIEIPVYRFEHDRQLDPTIMIAYMNYVAVSSSVEDIARYHYKMSKSAGVTNNPDLKLSQTVYRHVFSGMSEDEAVEAYFDSHMEEEKAHSDTFRFIACGLKRRVNRMRLDHEEKLGTEILQKEQRDDTEPRIHLCGSFEPLKAKHGIRKVSNANFELEAKINAIRHSKHPEIILLGIVQQQRVSHYNLCSDFALGMLGKRLFGRPSVEYADWENYLITPTSDISQQSADIMSAGGFWYPVQFLDYTDRDIQRPGWRNFVLS